MLILENTLYTNQQEKDQLLAQSDQVMNALIVNYFGFLGLFKLGARRGTLKNYSTDELSVRLTSITDDNQDPSLVVKLAYDVGLIRRDVVDQMTRLLAALKQKKIQTGKDLDETKVRELASLIRVDSHRPSPVILQLFKSFTAGDVSLGQFTRDIYRVTKRKDLKLVSAWFRDKVRSGAFLPIFAKLPASITTAQPIAATSTQVQPPNTPQMVAGNVSIATTVPSTIRGTNPPDEYPVNTGLNAEALTDTIIRGNYDTIRSIKEVSIKDIEFAEKWLEENFTTVAFDIRKVLDQGVNNELHKELSVISIELADRIAGGLVALQTSHWLSNLANKPEVLAAEIGRIVNFGKKLFDINFALSGTRSEIRKTTSKKNSDSRETIKLSFWRDFESMLSRDANLPVDVFKTLEQNSLIDHRRDWANDSLDRQSMFLLGAVGKVWTNLFPPNYFRDVIKNTFGPSLITADLLPGNTFEVSIDISKVDEKVKSILSMTEKYPKLKSLFRVLDTNSLGGDPAATASLISIIRDGIEKRKFNSIADIEKALSGIDLSKVSIHELKKFVSEEQKKGTRFNTFMLNAIDGGFDKGKLTDLFTQVYEKAIPEGVLPLGILLPYYYYDTNFSKKITPAIDEFVEKNFDQVLKKENWAGSLLFIHTYNMGSRGRQHDFFLRWVPKLMAALEDRKVPNLQNLDKFYLIVLKMKKAGTFKEKIWMDSFQTYKEVLTRATNVISEIDLRKEFIEMELSHSLKIDVIETYQRPAKTVYHISPTTGMVSPTDGLSYGFLPEDLTTEKALEQFTERLKNMDIYGSSGFGIHPDVFKYNSKLMNEYNRFVRERSGDQSFRTTHPFDVIASAFRDPESTVDPKKVLEEVDFRETLNATERSFSKINSLAGKLTELLQSKPEVITEKALVNLLSATTTSEIKLKGDANSALAELRDTVISHYLKSMGSDPVMGDRIFEVLDEEGKKMVSGRLKEISFLTKSLDVILHDDCPIKPKMKLDIRDMGDILKKNRVKVGKDKLKKGEKISEFKQRLDDKVPIEPLHVKEIPISEEELQRKSAEYDALNNGKHGAIGVRILKEFDVNLPIQEEGQREFEAKYPDSEIHERQFHGCGSIAASFILRYGYAIFKEGDSRAVKTAGKMLGDGLYVSNIITKAIQYATDDGMRPAETGIGHKGYLFLNRAVLGERGTHYEFAGGGGDNIRSPEWACFFPNEQLRIYKAYETEIVHKSEIDKLKQKFSMNEDKPLKIRSFKDFLTEAQLLGENGMRRANYIFKDGYIPVSKEQTVYFNDLKDGFFNDNISMEYTPYGPMISLTYQGAEDEVFFVDYVGQIMRSEKDLDKFLRILKATENGGVLSDTI